MTTYKRFVVDNRYTQQRNAVVSIVFPFHEREIQMNNAGDPLLWLNQNLSVVFNNQIYSTAWIPVGAPWLVENSNDTYVRFARADIFAQNIPVGETTGWVTGASNQVPAYIEHPSLVSNLTNTVITARYSGVYILDAATGDCLSGSSSGTYTAQLHPINANNLVDTRIDRGLRRTYKSEVWLGHERHRITPDVHWDNVYNSNIPGGRYVTGFCHAEMWMTTYSNCPYVDYTFRFGNDKLNNPVVNSNGESRSIYYSAYLTGDFSLRINGPTSTAIKFYSGFGFTESGFLGQTNHYKLPVVDIGDAQRWTFKASADYSTTTGAYIQARYPIYGLPVLETWAQAGYIEYPVVQNTALIPPALRPSYRSILNGNKQNNLWNTLGNPWDNNIVGISYKFFANSGSQSRFGRIPLSVLPIIYSHSADAVDNCYASETRIAVFPHQYRHLFNRLQGDISRFLPVRRASPRDPDGIFRSYQWQYPWDSCYVWIKDKPMEYSAGGGLGRTRTRNVITDPLGFGAHPNQKHGWNGIRHEHFGSFISFYLGLVTDDEYIKNYVTEWSALSYAQVPRYGASVNPDDHNAYPDSHYAIPRATARPLRAPMQDWLLNNNQNSRFLYTQRVLDLCAGQSGSALFNGRDLVWETYPGIHASSQRYGPNRIRFPRNTTPGQTFYVMQGDAGVGSSPSVVCDTRVRDINGSFVNNVSCNPTASNSGRYRAPLWPGDRPVIENWQLGMVADRLALGYKYLHIPEARNTIRNIILDCSSYWHIPPGDYNTWVYRTDSAYPGHPDCPGMPKFGTAEAVEQGSNNIGPYGPLNAITGLGYYSVSHDDLTSWGYAGNKAYTLVFDQVSEPALYERARRLTEANEFVRGFRETGFFDPGNGNLPENAASYMYVGEWNYTSNVFPPNSDPNTRPVVFNVDFSGSPTSGEAGAGGLTVTFTGIVTPTPEYYRWDFNGNGTIDLSTSANTVNTLYTPGVYTVSLVAGSGIYSGSHTKFNYIQVNNPQNYSVEFTGTPLTGTIPFDVVFTDLTSPAPSTREWRFEAGGTVISTTGNSITGRYTTSGAKDVTLTVRDSSNPNRFGSLTKGSYIQANPESRTVWTNIDFTGNPRVSYGPADITFTSLITPTPQQFRWDFNNNGTVDSNLASDTFRYSTTGLYSVRLTAWSGSIGTASYSEASVLKTNYIDIRDFLVFYNVSFSANVTEGQVPLSVTFTDTTTPAQTTTKRWDFENDGVVDVTTTNSTVTHVYQTTGLKSVRLSGSSSNGNGQAIRQNYIYVSPIDYAPSIEASIRDGYAPLIVQLTPIIDGTLLQPTEFNWNYGAGVSNLRNPTVTYNNPGLYDISLSCSRTGIGNGYKLEEGFIIVKQRQAPTISFSVSPIEQLATRPVVFNFAYTNDSPTSWYIDFGNNTTQNLSLNQTSLTYTYNEPGVYSPQLVAINNGGTTIRTIPTLLITDPNDPQLSSADFIASPVSGVNPLVVSFTDISTNQNSILARSWNFGDGGTSSEQNPIYTYSGSGMFNVSLSITSFGGTSDMTKENYVSVTDRSLDLLYVDIVSSIEDTFYPGIAFFRDTTSGDVSSRSWNLINGQTGDSTAEFPCAIYTNPGYISPSLITTSSSGVSSTGYFENLISLEDLRRYSPSANYYYYISNYGTVVKESPANNISYNASSIVSRIMQQASPTSSTNGIVFSSISGNYVNSIMYISNIKQSIVNKARLHMAVSSITGDMSYGDITVDVYRSPLTLNSPSWNRRNVSPNVRWTQSGASGIYSDLSKNPVFSFTIPFSQTGSSDPNNFTYTFDITDYMRRSAHDNISSLVFIPRHDSSAYVTMNNRGVIDMRYRNIPASVIRPDSFVITNGSSSNTTGYPIVSGWAGNSGEMKTILKFNLEDSFGDSLLREVALTKAVLTIPYEANTSYEILPVINRILRPIDNPTWAYYSGTSGWSTSGASGEGSDISAEYINVIYPDVVTGDFRSDFSGISNRVDTLQYDLTEDIASHISIGTSKEISYLLSYPKGDADSQVSNYVIGTPDSYGTVTDLHIYSTYVRDIEPVPIYPIDPGETGATGSTGNTGITGITGANFIIYRGDPSNGYITSSVFATTSGYLFQANSNYIHGGASYHYEKLFAFNTTDDPISNVKLRILGEHQHQISIANEKVIGDNTDGSYITMPSGYTRRDFIKCDSRNNYISLGDLDVSGYTGFWIRVELPENIRKDSEAFIYPVITYEIPGEE